MNGPRPILVVPPGRRGSGGYSIRVDVARPLDEAGANSIERIVALFCEVGSKGAFPAPGCPPSASRVRMGETFPEEPYRLACHIDGEDFDLLGFELLRNMGDRLARDEVRIRQFLISSDGSPTDVRLKPAPTSENELDAYPPVSPLTRFRLAGEGTDVGKLRRCLVELALGVDASHVSRLDQWVANWFDVLEAGAFSMPVGPAWETDCIRGTVALFDEVTVEVVVDRFQSSDTAWHALINMLDACWAAEQLIAKVTID